MSFFKKAAHKATQALSDDNELYQNIQTLIFDLKNELKTEQKNYHAFVPKYTSNTKLATKEENNRAIEIKAITEAVGQVTTKLQKALNDYDTACRNFPLGAKSNYEQLALTARKVIFDYQPQLTAAPGFWNKIKAHINAFLEKHFYKKEALNADLNSMGRNKTFSIQYDKTKSLLEIEAAKIEEEQWASITSFVFGK